MHDMEVLEPMFLHVHKEGLELTVTEDEQAEHEEHFLFLCHLMFEKISMLRGRVAHCQGHR